MRQAMSAERVLDAVANCSDEMFEFLRHLVLLETPSLDPQSQGPALELLGNALLDQGFHARRLPGKTSGGQLFARPSRRRRKTPTQLLLGHCDTVWPQGTLTKMPVEQRDGRMTGPGIYDMKGGLTQMIFALRALRSLALEPAVTPLVLVTTDEEIGGADSKRLICNLARMVDRALVLEPSLTPLGKLKIARKGVGQYHIRVTGRAAHAGLDPEAGISAILELSHVIQQLHALNDPEAGISVNVGRIDGGLRPNVIAPESEAFIDVRVPTVADAERIDAAIHALTPTVSGALLEVEMTLRVPPMEPTPANQRLRQRAQELASQLGFDLQAGAAGGASDGNYTSQYTATLDGLGAVGDGAHAVHEHVELEAMLERTALLALLLMQPPLS